MKTLALVFLLVFPLSLIAQIEINSQGTTYKSPAIGELKSPEALKSAGATAQMAAQAVGTELVGLTASAKATEADLSALSSKRQDYATQLDNYNKTSLGPYKEDLGQYNINLNKYTSLVNAHNADVATNNALPADKRDATNVAKLNSQKADLDDWKGKLDTWKGNLDTKKAGVDQQFQIVNAAWNDLQQQSATLRAQLNTIQAKLKLAYQQLLSCKNYADQCNTALKTNYPTYTGFAANDWFGTTVWKGTLADLETEMEKLKALSGKGFDGN